MALTKITWSDKTTLNPQPSIARENKCTDADLNEVKSVVNGAIDQIENITGTILWTNPDPTSSFASQDITLSSDDYDVLEIYYRHYTTDSYILSQRTIKGAGTILLTNIAGSIKRRQITQSNDTSLSIAEGDNTSAMIPVYVVGYKTGLFS